MSVHLYSFLIPLICGLNTLESAQNLVPDRSKYYIETPHSAILCGLLVKSGTNQHHVISRGQELVGYTVTSHHRYMRKQSRLVLDATMPKVLHSDQKKDHIHCKVHFQEKQATQLALILGWIAPRLSLLEGSKVAMSRRGAGLGQIIHADHSGNSHLTMVNTTPMQHLSVRNRTLIMEQASNIQTLKTFL
ncbi:hypothetical protein BaRGS_00012163 [Batillaria attramentaria]|uniref:Uncharacterized protein n=1 Tax=Batillaria attramentaria TaxID=370345 RepID=A0ABD0LAB3_9CAEN